jgi:hypothetical protein
MCSPEEAERIPGRDGIAGRFPRIALALHVGSTCCALCRPVPYPRSKTLKVVPLLSNPDFASLYHRLQDQHPRGWGLDAFLDREQERYRSQLERYATVLRKLDARPIRLGLYFPLLGGWREWDAP